jgi:rhodanese-related sulfurtransferase
LNTRCWTVNLAKGFACRNVQRILYLLNAPPYFWGAPLLTITKEELRAMISKQEPFVLMDTRSHRDYAGGHLPGAVSIPSDHVGKHVLERYRKTDTIVTYCTDSDCEAGAIATAKLETLGFLYALEFKGGIEERKSVSYPIEKQPQLPQNGFSFLLMALSCSSTSCSSCFRVWF